MAGNKLNKDGLNKVWLKVMELVKSLTGNVDRTKGTLQEQVNELNSNLDTKAALTQISNPNLLDNPWFTVNQRNFESANSVATGYGNEVYVADRWRSGYWGGTWSYSDNGIYAEKTNGQVTLVQTFSLDNLYPLLGKTVTVSIMNSNYEVQYVNFTLPKSVSSDSKIEKSTNNKELSVRIEWNVTNGYWNIIFYVLGTSFTYRAAKLELGNVSTLAMDTTPNYEEELMKCSTSTADSNDTYANKPNYSTLLNTLDIKSNLFIESTPANRNKMYITANSNLEIDFTNEPTYRQYLLTFGQNLYWVIKYTSSMGIKALSTNSSDIAVSANGLTMTLNNNSNGPSYYCVIPIN